MSFLITRIRGHRVDLRVWRRIRRSDVIGALGAAAILLWVIGVVKKWW